MIRRFFNRLTGKISPKKAPTGPKLNRTGAHLRDTGDHTVTPAAKPKRAVPKSQPESIDLDPHVEGRIDETGPGKNVLIRNKYLREDTGTHETLTIIDDSIIDTAEEGTDPYNSGAFDTSKIWSKRPK